MFILREQCLLLEALDGKQQSAQVWTLFRTLGVQFYFLQFIITLFVEFWRLTCGRTKEFLLLLQRMRVFEICIVRITKTAIKT
jgi:hypothetical protein